MSDKPIDPYWWCQHDEKLERLFWERVERPYLVEQLKKFDDPKFWEPTPKKKGLTLVECLAVLAILLTLAGLLWPAISAARATAARHAAGGEPAVREPSKSWSLSTEQHDGHWWVTYLTIHAAAFQHHPDCPCHDRTAESEDK